MTMHESRSAAPARSPDLPDVGPELGGVGARQGDPCPGQEGGGYLNECTSPEFLELAKIQEFSEMGLPAVLIRVAQDIGYDAFLRVWKTLDAAAEMGEIKLSDSGSMIQVRLRRYKSFQRFQRNRWIEQLAGQGMPTAAIQQKVKEKLGETLHRNSINRLAIPGRKKSEKSHHLCASEQPTPGR